MADPCETAPISNSNGGARPLVSLGSGVGVEKVGEGQYKLVSASENTPTPSGINTSSLKYEWLQSSDGTPTASQITNSFALNGEVTSALVTEAITKNTESGNDWKLWVYAEDTLGNSTIAGSDVFYLDNELPTVTANPTSTSSYVRSQSVTITHTDQYSGFSTTAGAFLNCFLSAEERGQEP